MNDHVIRTTKRVAPIPTQESIPAKRLQDRVDRTTNVKPVVTATTESSSAHGIYNHVNKLVVQGGHAPQQDPSSIDRTINFLRKSSTDNYITGLGSVKFYTITLFVYFLIILSLFGYGIISRMDSLSLSVTLKTNSSGLSSTHPKEPPPRLSDRDGGGDNSEFALNRANDTDDFPIVPPNPSIVIGRNGNDTKSNSPIKDKKKMIQSISNTSIANIALLFSGIMFVILFFLKWTRPIPYEFAFFILAIWIIFGCYAKSECICCTSSLDKHQGTTLEVDGDDNDDRTVKDPTHLSDFVNHLIKSAGICNHIELITSLHNITIIILTALLYIVIYRDYDYFTLERRARFKLKRTIVYSTDEERPLNAKDINTMVNEPRLSSDQYNVQRGTNDTILLPSTIPADTDSIRLGDLPKLKILLITVILILALALPLSCNNALNVTLENYMLRIILFAIIFLLRLVNSYSGKYTLPKLAATVNTLFTLNDKGKTVDSRIEGLMWTDEQEDLILEASMSDEEGEEDNDNNNENADPILMARESLRTRSDHNNVKKQQQRRPRTVFNGYAMNGGGSGSNVPSSSKPKIIKRSQKQVEEDKLYGDMRSFENIERQKKILDAIPATKYPWASPAKTDLILRHLQNLSALQLASDMIISSLVLFICGWYLMIALVQVIYEFVILYFNVEKYGNIYIRLHKAYNKGEVIKYM